MESFSSAWTLSHHQSRHKHHDVLLYVPFSLSHGACLQIASVMFFLTLFLITALLGFVSVNRNPMESRHWMPGAHLWRFVDGRFCWLYIVYLYKLGLEPALNVPIILVWLGLKRKSSWRLSKCGSKRQPERYAIVSSVSWPFFRHPPPTCGSLRAYWSLHYG